VTPTPDRPTEREMMTVTGNRPPPYHAEGLAQCLQQIRQACEKGRTICGEKEWLAFDLGFSRIQTINGKMLAEKEPM
jgi:hypothetical protein